MPRTEQEIFDELAELCISPGYIHAVSFLCWRDNALSFSEKLTAEHMQRMFSMDRLSRTEMSTLIGLMVKAPIDFTLSDTHVLQQYIDRTDSLLGEIHQAMSQESFGIKDWKKIADEGGNPFGRGAAMREPIFYGGESAYSFQYRDLSPRKYGADEEWLQANKGFTIGVARDVAVAIGELLIHKLPACLELMRNTPTQRWSVLPAYTFTAQEIAERLGLEAATVRRVLDAFTLPSGVQNDGFKALCDFNATNAQPIIRNNEGGYVLFQGYSLMEALYEAPFYWMGADKGYMPTAMQNRGQFTEMFAKERLELVFGQAHVYSNVEIFQSKGQRLGEIDVLVVFADRAIVLQAKSKRLTLEARKGNDLQIKDDFKKSVQDSYDQGYRCGKLLCDDRYTLTDAFSNEIVIPRQFKEVYVLCVVSDHYPALSFQVRQFLKCDESDLIRPPFVLDIFTLDAITEMLQSPLRFLSYLNRRTEYTDRLMSAHELTILSYHLKTNLWLDKQHDLFMLDGSISADLDVAMAVRRDDLPGQRTPEGILTRHAGTTLERLLQEIEAKADAGTIEFGFMLLTLNEETFKAASDGINQAVAKARRDGQTHDITIGLGVGDTGFTIHCNAHPVSVATAALQRHCERRKYTQKARSWFGLCIHPNDKTMRFGMCIEYPWVEDPAMDEITRGLAKPKIVTKALRSLPSDVKIGRNDPCPCGSGRKYKKCCSR